MKSNYNHSNEGLRSVERAKRRKTNLILNSLIGLVLLLIIIVSVSIFSGDSEGKEPSQEQTVEKKVSSNNEENTEKKASNSDDESSEDEQKTETVVINDEENTAKTVSGKVDTTHTNKKPSAPKNQSKPDAEEKAQNNNSTDSLDSHVVTIGGGDNIKSTYINPDWKPIGTTQPGPYSNENVDWEEREKALAYAIGVDVNNMTNWYLGRAGEKQSIGTVSPKNDLNRTFRVYLEWKDGQGWKPVKVEELIVNDKR